MTLNWERSTQIYNFKSGDPSKFERTYSTVEYYQSILDTGNNSKKLVGQENSLGGVKKITVFYV